jgi:hypothetical protein
MPRGICCDHLMLSQPTSKKSVPPEPRALSPRASYLVAFITLLVTLSADVASLLGVDLLYIVFPLLLATGIVVNSLMTHGFYYGSGRWKIFTTPGLKKLPWWARSIVVLAWVFGIASIVGTFLFFQIYGDIHLGHYYNHGHIRAATDFEIRRENTWVLFAFSGVVVPLLTYPAMLLFYDRRLAQ